MSLYSSVFSIVFWEVIIVAHVFITARRPVPINAVIWYSTIYIFFLVACTLEAAMHIFNQKIYDAL